MPEEGSQPEQTTQVFDLTPQWQSLREGVSNAKADDINKLPEGQDQATITGKMLESKSRGADNAGIISTIGKRGEIILQLTNQAGHDTVDRTLTAIQATIITHMRAELLNKAQGVLQTKSKPPEKEGVAEYLDEISFLLRPQFREVYLEAEKNIDPMKGGLPTSPNFYATAETDETEHNSEPNQEKDDANWVNTLIENGVITEEERYLVETTVSLWRATRKTLADKAILLDPAQERVNFFAKRMAIATAEHMSLATGKKINEVVHMQPRPETRDQYSDTIDSISEGIDNSIREVGERTLFLLNLAKSRTEDPRAKLRKAFEGDNNNEAIKELYRDALGPDNPVNN